MNANFLKHLLKRSFSSLTEFETGAPLCAVVIFLVFVSRDERGSERGSIHKAKCIFWQNKLYEKTATLLLNAVRRELYGEQQQTCWFNEM